MKKYTKFRSSFRFPRTSFLTGAGSAFNIAGNYYRFTFPENAAEADAKALEADWNAIGNDLRRAMASFDEIVQRD
ncbi:MAG: hypothetical protein IBJ09_10055 [Bacteroidia bacterium]|nr:hypothetical protein [Bacteroidia bacterium]